MEKVLLALSGGVDSAVSVHLLQKAGYDVYGYTFLASGAEKDRQTVAQDAKTVADFFAIPHFLVDIKEEFDAKVVKYFVESYAQGQTPNPCVFCNRRIKFPKLLAAADELGIEKVATGHYVQVAEGMLKRGADLKKDQSYVLCLLPHQDIRRLVFPLGSYSKEQIRAIAAAIDLPVAQKKDSQEICFIPNDDYGAFMRKFPNTYKQGDFLNCLGQVLGQHKGLPFYTVGQRRGIGIACGKPLYVTALNWQKNQIYLGSEAELYQSAFRVKDVNYLVPALSCEAEFAAAVKIRYLSSPVSCLVRPQKDGSAEVILAQAQKSVTPGQFAVFYRRDQLLGGGMIDSFCVEQ